MEFFAEHWYLVLAGLYLASAAAIMASYEWVYRPRADKPWIEVIVGTLIWVLPPFVFDAIFPLPKLLFQLVLLGSLLVTGGAMMSWIFLVHLRNEEQVQANEQGNLLQWQKDMIADAEIVFQRQAQLIADALRGNLEIENITGRLQQQQEALSKIIQQVDLYRRIGDQTLQDLQEGIASCYLMRKKKAVEAQGGVQDEEEPIPVEWPRHTSAG